MSPTLSHLEKVTPRGHALTLKKDMSKNTLRGEAVNWNTELRSYGAFQEPKKTLKTVKKP